MQKKEKCEKCKRTIRYSKLRENKLTKEIMCLRCLNKYGENKYYSPLKRKGNKLISNFNITDFEKKVLLRRKNFKDINILCEG